jgi:hypothetical protein
MSAHYGNRIRGGAPEFFNDSRNLPAARLHANRNAEVRPWDYSQYPRTGQGVLFFFIRISSLVFYCFSAL